MTAEKMSEESASANQTILNAVVETLGENIKEQVSAQFTEVKNSSPAQASKAFERQKTVHQKMGGGKSADLLLWRDKKLSSSVLGVATALWILFEWIDYHFLTISSFVIILGMVVQFGWSTAASILTKSAPQVPRLHIPKELFVNIAVALDEQLNSFLGFLQDVSCGGDIKQFLMVVFSLWAASVIGSWFSFITVIYIGFIAAHTLPALYEKYQVQVDQFVWNMLELLRQQYKSFDENYLSKIPKNSLLQKKAQ